jgi:hypothetical protein
MGILSAMRFTDAHKPNPTESEEDVRGDHDTSIKTIKTTSTVVSSSTTVEETPHESYDDDQSRHEVDPLHPGKSDISHLGSPSTSEEFVHADRLEEWQDPLKEAKRKNEGKRT